MRIPLAVSAFIFTAGLVSASAPTARADEPVSYETGDSLLAKYHCDLCHRAYDPANGPSLHAIAEKYASDPHARDNVAISVLNGSVGAWGPIPMPGYPVPESDLRPLVEWILSLEH
jgi:cytochrome c